MRGELIAADDPTRPTIINDAYNANPTSMHAALDLLAGYPSPRWAVLGDMLPIIDAKLSRDDSTRSNRRPFAPRQRGAARQPFSAAGHTNLNPLIGST